MMNFERAERIKHLPPYLFAEIDRMKEEVKKRGMDIIDLGVGDPDLPTPGNIIDKLKVACQDPENHRYPSYTGMDDFRVSVANWCRKRFGVKLDYRTEVVSLIGSKEGIAHLPLAFVNPGDVVLDFFAGSGSTGAAALERGCSFILMDNNKESIRVMHERFKDADIEWY